MVPTINQAGNKIMNKSMEMRNIRKSWILGLALSVSPFSINSSLAETPAPQPPLLLNQESEGMPVVSTPNDSNPKAAAQTVVQKNPRSPEESPVTPSSCQTFEAK